MGATTLARLPFRLGLGRVMDAIVYLQASYAHLYSCPYSDAICFMYDLDLCIVYFDSWSLRGYIIYSFVGSIVNLCNCCYGISPASRARSNVHEALGGAFPKRHHVDCGLIAIICKVPILGRYATTLSSWSPNEVAHCLGSSRLFPCAVAREQRKAFTTSSFHKPRFFLTS
jgi:hypothetical protein